MPLASASPLDAAAGAVLPVLPAQADTSCIGNRPWSPNLLPLEDSSGGAALSLQSQLPTGAGLLTGLGSYRWKEANVTYVGTFVAGQPEGRGIYIWPNGDRYIGEVSGGLRHGWGHFSANNGCVYSGQWRCGRRYGLGTSTDADGTKYAGEWKDSIRAGRGTCTYPTGGSYCGAWRANNKNGFGTMVWTDPAQRYTGGWVAGAPEGYGRHTWLAVAGVEQLRGMFLPEFQRLNEYQGQWKAGRRQGHGVFQFSDGSTYDGAFVSDAKEGLGRLTLPDGRIYTGTFKNDRMAADGHSPAPPPPLPWVSKKERETVSTPSLAEMLADLVGATAPVEARLVVTDNDLQAALAVLDRRRRDLQEVYLANRSSEVVDAPKTDPFLMTAADLWILAAAGLLTSAKFAIVHLNRATARGRFVQGLLEQDVQHGTDWALGRASDCEEGSIGDLQTDNDSSADSGKSLATGDPDSGVSRGGAGVDRNDPPKEEASDGKIENTLSKTVLTGHTPAKHEQTPVQSAEQKSTLPSEGISGTVDRQGTAPSVAACAATPTNSAPAGDVGRLWPARVYAGGRSWFLAQRPHDIHSPGNPVLFRDLHEIVVRLAQAVPFPGSYPLADDCLHSRVEWTIDRLVAGARCSSPAEAPAVTSLRKAVDALKCLPKSAARRLAACFQRQRHEEVAACRAAASPSHDACLGISAVLRLFQHLGLTMPLEGLVHPVDRSWPPALVAFEEVPIASGQGDDPASSQGPPCKTATYPTATPSGDKAAPYYQTDTRSQLLELSHVYAHSAPASPQHVVALHKNRFNKVESSSTPEVSSTLVAADFPTHSQEHLLQSRAAGRHTTNTSLRTCCSYTRIL
eukprot:GHVT01025573.1.p1 GENE.GHVT01025573.1~~GHVT01025573.1.p1  ORF type:complete len:852 (+),score=120.93 GHVT01025573.1:204-2759(+)